MRITKFGHSCLLVEENEARLLFDPGNPEYVERSAEVLALTGLTAIFITHEHGDHADQELLKRVLAKNPVPVYGNLSVKRALGAKGIEVALFDDMMIKAGGVQVEAFPAPHGPLFMGAPENTAYVVGGKLLIAGDSLDDVLVRFKGIKAMAIAVVAPWMKEVEATALLDRVLPHIVIPVHDGVVKTAFRTGKQAQWVKHLGDSGMALNDAGPESPLEI